MTELFIMLYGLLGVFTAGLCNAKMDKDSIIYRAIDIAFITVFWPYFLGEYVGDYFETDG